MKTPGNKTVLSSETLPAFTPENMCVLSFDIVYVFNFDLIFDRVRVRVRVKSEVRRHHRYQALYVITHRVSRVRHRRPTTRIGVVHGGGGHQSANDCLVDSGSSFSSFFHVFLSSTTQHARRDMLYLASHT